MIGRNCVARMALALLGPLALLAQPPSAGAPSPLSFEVATVKPNRSNDPGGNLDFENNGRLVARNVPLQALIAEAYHVRPESLSGAPKWAESERFDVIAKAPPSTSPDNLRRMMVTLLRERFKLAAHTEQKLLPAYALVVATKGAHLERSAPARAVDGGCGRARPATPGDIAVRCRNMSMADLADTLPDIAGGYIHAPVVDQTGIQGAYDFRLSWTPEGLRNGNPTGSGASVFDALQDQLGLKLESKKLPLPVLVIDHVERIPVEN